VLAGLPVGAPEPPAQREAYLWPDNVKNWRYWQSVQTQWRTGMAGPTGLDYAGVRSDLEITHRLQGKTLRKALVCIKAAERATLDVLAEKRTAKEQEQKQKQP